MGLNDKVVGIQEGLQEIVREMSKYIFGDFEIVIRSITRNARNHMDEPDSNSSRYNAYNSLSEIEDFYRKVPYSLRSKKEFRPLFNIRDELPKFREAFDKVFNEQSDAAYLLLEGHSNILIGNHILYMAMLRDYTTRIRKHGSNKIPSGESANSI